MKNLTHRNSFHVFLNDEEAEILDKKFRLSGKSSIKAQFLSIINTLLIRQKSLD